MVNKTDKTQNQIKGKQKKKRRFRKFFFLFLTFLVIVILLFFSTLRQLGEFIGTKILHTQVKISRFVFLPDGVFYINNVTLANPPWCKKPYWITVERISGKLNIQKLLWEKKVYFDTLLLEKPTFYLEIMEDGESNIPDMGGGSEEKKDDEGPRVADVFAILQADSVELRDGFYEMYIADEHIQLIVPTVSLQGQKVDLEKPTYNASFQIENAHFTLDDTIDVTASLRGKEIIVDADGCTLTGEPLRLQTGSTVFWSTKGNLRHYAYPYLTFLVQSRIDSADIQRALFLPVDLQGEYGLKIELEGLADDLTARGKLDLKDKARVWEIGIAGLSSELKYEKGRVNVSDMNLTALNGTLSGKGWLHFLDDTSFSLESSFKDLGLTDSLGLVPLKLPLKGKISGKVRIAGDDFLYNRLQAKLQLTADIAESTVKEMEVLQKDEVQPEGDSPAEKGDSLSVAASLEQGIATFDDISANLHKNELQLQGTFAENGSLDASYRLSSSNLGKLYSFIYRSMELNGFFPKNVAIETVGSRRLAKRKVYVPIQGTGLFTGTIGGLITGPHISVIAETDTLRVSGIKIDHFDCTLHYQPEKIHLEQLDIKSKRMVGSVQGYLYPDSITDFSTFSRDVFQSSFLNALHTSLPQCEASLRVSNFDISLLSRMLTEFPKSKGMFDIDMTVKNDERFEGHGNAIVRNLEIYDEKVFQMALSFHTTETDFMVDSMKMLFFDADLGLSEIIGSGRIDTANAYTLKISSERLKSKFFNSLTAYDIPVEGVVTGIVSGEGSLNDPRLDGSFTVYDLKLNQNQLGIGQLGFTLSESEIHWNISLLKHHIAGDGIFNVNDGSIRSGEFTLERTEFLPYLTLIGFEMEGLRGHTTGKISLSGKFASLEELLVTADFDHFEVGLGDYAITNESPLQLSLQKGLINILPFTFTGQHTSLYGSGSIDLLSETIKLGFEGQVNLELLPLIEKEIKLASGNFSFGLNLEGVFARPYLFAECTIGQAEIVPTSFPLDFKNINAKLQLNNQILEIQQASAQLGDGTIILEGGMTLPGLDNPDPFQTVLDISIKADSCDIDYPDGFDGKISADLMMTKKLQSPFFNGNVTLISGTYEEDFNIRAMILATLRDVLKSRSVEGAEPADDDGFNPQFNIEIRQKDKLQFVSTDVLASLVIDLSLYGDLRKPLLYGNVEIAKGEVYIDDRIINISSGIISFLNPQGIYPTFDIQGRSTIEDHEVMVTVSGEYPDFLLSFSADGNLTKNQILALLLTGRADVGSQETGYVESIKFASDLVLNNQIISKVKDIFSIKKFEIAPVYGQSGTVGMQITAGMELSGWYITYTRLPETTDYDIITAERELSRRLVIEFLRDRDNSFSGDIRFKFPFP